MENQLIYETDNWKYGIENLKAIITEQGYISKLAFIKMKWLIGEQVAKDDALIKHKKEVAEEIGYPLAEVNRCINWYNKSKELYKCEEWEDIEALIEKNMSWHKIINQLPAPDEAQEEERARLENERNRTRVRKVFKLIEREVDENKLTLSKDLLNHLVIKYQIDLDKNYDI